MQLYDATKTPPTELGAPVALSITGDGTAGSPYVATLGPFAQPLRITVAVQATGGAGSVSTALSDQSTAVVVGESGCGRTACLPVIAVAYCFMEGLRQLLFAVFD